MNRRRWAVGLAALLMLVPAGCAASTEATGRVPGASYQEDHGLPPSIQAILTRGATPQAGPTGPVQPLLTTMFARPHRSRPERCRILRSQLRREGEIGTYGDHGPHIGVIGDSYTQGDGQKDRSKRWVVDLSRLRPGIVTADGVGYTGFVNPGPCGHQAYGTRVHNLPSDDTTVLLQGGLNDLKAPRKAIVNSVITLVRRFHGVRVVIIGPVDAPGATGEAAVDSALREAAARTHTEYLSMLDLHPGFLPEGIHMTTAGHEAFAQRVADFLTR